MKIVILCGGLGSRLAEVTKLIPKPMVKIGNKPIIDHIINIYKKHGFNDFILATGYKNKILEKYFLNKKNINCIYTGKNTLTGGRLLRLKNYFKKDENFLLTYADGLTNQNLNKLVKFHLKHKKIATLTSVKPPARFGELKITGNRVKSFKEKPQLQNNWINGGYFVVEPEFLDLISNDKTVLEEEPLEKAASMGQLEAYLHGDFWHCVDTKRDKVSLDDIWKTGAAPWIKR